MAQLSIQSLNVAGGLLPTLSAASAAGDIFVNTGREILVVQNFDTLPHTVTIAPQAPCTQGIYHPVSIVVSTGDRRTLGPFPQEFYADAGRVSHVSYDDATAVTIACLAPY